MPAISMPSAKCESGQLVATVAVAVRVGLAVAPLGTLSSLKACLEYTAKRNGLFWRVYTCGKSPN